jgi:hypothetical protein
MAFLRRLRQNVAFDDTIAGLLDEINTGWRLALPRRESRK